MTTDAARALADDASAVHPALAEAGVGGYRSKIAAVATVAANVNRSASRRPERVRRLLQNQYVYDLVIRRSGL